MGGCPTTISCIQLPIDYAGEAIYLYNADAIGRWMESNTIQFGRFYSTRMEPIMSRHCVFRSMQIAEFDAFTFQTDYTQRTSCRQSSNYFYPFRSINELNIITHQII